jgi:hypothetical protein
MQPDQSARKEANPETEENEGQNPEQTPATVSDALDHLNQQCNQAQNRRHVKE